MRVPLAKMAIETGDRSLFSSAGSGEIKAEAIRRIRAAWRVDIFAIPDEFMSRGPDEANIKERWR